MKQGPVVHGGVLAISERSNGRAAAVHEGVFYYASDLRNTGLRAHIVSQPAEFGFPLLSAQVPMSLSERTNLEIDEILLLCQSRIGYQFTDQRLLRRCLTHSSSAETRLDSNERLEFLGDAVLGLVICEYLFSTYPDQREGQLTQMKSQLVSRAVCARVARRLRLNELVLVGRGLNSIPESILSAVVESLIAGIYTDSGLAAAREFILAAFSEDLLLCGPQETDNYKSQLQEQTQRFHSVTPDYLVLEERGPDHAREFLIAARIGVTVFEAAWGRSKKEAEQQAARIALSSMSAAAGSPQELAEQDPVDGAGRAEHGATEAAE